MVTRDLSNKRVQLWLGPASGFANLENGWATAAEVNACLKTAPAVRWDGLDFGMSESDQVDDRSLDDDASATIAGFMQFGGAVPFFMPKVTDLTSILRQVYNLVKVQGTELALVQRIGFEDRRTVAAAGDNVNLYKVMVDGFNPDTEGDGGYAYLQNMIPRGDVAPWSILAGAAPAAVAIVGGLTLSLAVGALGLRGATYIGNNVANRVTWASSNPAVATVDNRGIIEAKSSGTANITASYPGGTTSPPCVVTVA